MQKNEFEKQVRQKIDDLKIHPSESVWQNVEARLPKARRRRRGWIFWPALFIALLCGGYFLWHQETNTTPSEYGSSKKYVNEKNPVKQEDMALRKPDNEKNTPPRTPPDKSPRKSIDKIRGNVKIQGFTEQGIQHTEKIGYSTATGREHTQQTGITTFSPPGLQESAAADHENNKKTGLDKSAGDTHKVPENSLSPYKNNTSVLPDNTVASNKANDVLDSVPGGNTEYTRVKNEITAAKQSSTIRLPSKNLWRWGLFFSAGVSGIPTGFLGSLDKSYSLADAISGAYPTQNNNFSTPPAPIKSSGALIAGFFAEKNVAKNNMITAGLNYKMFSTTNTIWSRNDSLFASFTGSMETRHHNYYHFLELPISLKVRLTSKVPVFLEGGVSISQLIASNALQLNNGVYEKNNSLFNKTQIGFNGGVSVSLFSMRKTSILAGPFMYYGTTRSATEGLYKNQHFTFIGLKSQVIFKKD